MGEWTGRVALSGILSFPPDDDGKSLAKAKGQSRKADVPNVCRRINGKKQFRPTVAVPAPNSISQKSH